MPLSDMKIRSLKPRAKDYKTSDSGGLMIITRPNGTKLWRMKYRFAGTEKTLSFGTYPLVPLLEARLLRDEAKRKIIDGLDPGRAKQIEKLEAEISSQTFRKVADRWFDINEKQWVSSYAIRLRNRLVDDVYPTLGGAPIADIRPQEVLTCIRKIEARGAIEMARRIYQMVGNIFKFAVAEGIIESDPTRDIGAALAPPNPVKHRIAIKGDDLPKLMETVGQYDGIAAMGVRFVVHTLVRTNELRLAEWTEFEDLDGSKPLWRISKEKMKMRREHLVPLTPQAASIIKALRKINGESQWVFRTPDSRRDQPMSNNAMLYFLYRAGFSGRATVHGFRATGSTLLNEQQFNRDWIEMQLAHVDASIRGVYNSALYLPQRREMMRWWSDFVEPMAAPAEAPVEEEEFADLLG